MSGPADVEVGDPSNTAEPSSTGIAGRWTRRSPNARRRLAEWSIIVAIAVLVAALLRLFVVQTFFIPSDSMVPTLNIGDRIVVDKLAYHLHGVGRGDVIVFNAPPLVARMCLTTDKVLVKRVVGLPGETISDRDGTVFINGAPLHETYLPKNDPDTTTASFPARHLGQNQYFVMGDNRRHSCDSRLWGTVPRSDIIGKADMRIWPIGRIGFL